LEKADLNESAFFIGLNQISKCSVTLAFTAGSSIICGLLVAIYSILWQAILLLSRNFASLLDLFQEAFLVILHT